MKIFYFREDKEKNGALIFLELMNLVILIGEQDMWTWLDKLPRNQCNSNFFSIELNMPKL